MEADHLGYAEARNFSRKRSASTSSRHTMPRSTSPQEPHLTKTGRPSKATKGQPVHHCYCGRTYTRAEHLRRHQQNHKPDAFPCDAAGCKRAFAREDLLGRHKAKHNDPLQAPSLLSRGVGHTPEPRAILPSVSVSFAPAPNHTSHGPADLRPGTGSDWDEPTIQQSVEEVGGQDVAYSTGFICPDNVGSAASYAPNGLNHDHDYQWDSTTPLMLGSQYDTQDLTYQQYVQPQIYDTMDAGQSWSTSTGASRVSSSPVLADPTAPMSVWRHPSPACLQLRTPASDEAYCDFSSYGTTTSSSLLGEPPQSDTAFSPEWRDLLEQDELLTPTSAPQAADFGMNQYHHRVDNEPRYLHTFWTVIHPFWPVVHKPTFISLHTSPLLRAAMVTLGAHATSLQIDMANACILHKRCLKVLKKRAVNASESYRTCDMQAIFLVELFSIFRSLTPPFQLSNRFEEVYALLARGSGVEALDTTAIGFDGSQGVFPPTLETESRRRLLAACYLLDSYHATCFGRQPVSIPDFVPASLMLPQPVRVWDDPASTSSRYFTPRGTLHQASILDVVSDSRSSEPLDIFTSLLLHAYRSRTKEKKPLNTTPSPPALAPRPPTPFSPSVELAHQTLLLCQTIPVRELLAVAGESWAAGEKLGSQAEYVGAQSAVRQWANSSPTAALSTALEIVRLHRLHAKTTLVFHEWSLHLACLVVWACAYASRTSGDQLLVADEIGLEETVDRLVLASTQCRISWLEARDLLVWAKGRMEKGGAGRFCRVVSGAVYVLGVLVERGGEEEWF